MVPSSGGVPIPGPRPTWQTAPLYIQGASGALPQHANIHAQLAASASQSLPKAAQAQMQPRAAAIPAQPTSSLPFQMAGVGRDTCPFKSVKAPLAPPLPPHLQGCASDSALCCITLQHDSAWCAGLQGLFGQHQQPQAHVLAALQKQAEVLMAQHQRNTMAAAAAAAQSRPSSAVSSGKPLTIGQPLGQAGQGQVQAGQHGSQMRSVSQQSAVQPSQVSQAQSQAISQQLLQQQVNQLAQQYRQAPPAPAAPEHQNRPP